MGDDDRRNLTCGLTEWACRQPQAPALLLPRDEVSYSQLDALTWQCARLLAGGGVRQGSVVGLAFASEFLFALTMLACMRLGATTFASALVPPGEAAQPTDGVRLDGLATDRPDRVGPSGIPSIVVEWSAIRAMPALADPGLMPEFPEAPWQFVTGSGTTGRPKVMAITHGQQRMRARIAECYRRLTPADRFMTMPQLGYAYARTMLCVALHVGGAFGLVERAPARTVEICRRHRFTILDATAFHVEQILSTLPGPVGAGATPALPTLRALAMTSSTVSDDLRRRIRAALTPNLIVLYATNEVSTIAAAGPPEVWDVPGTVGRVVPGVEIRILGADGLPVAPGAVGVLEVRSPALIDGYVDDREATAKVFRHGWFSTGDLVRRLEDGQLIYCGRSDHMMILNGINIFPAEIERALGEHPAVADAAAVPFSHPVYQDIPVCAVAVREGMGVSDGELMQFARERLGPRRPQVVVVVDRIPRNEQGKLIRSELAQALRERLGSARPAP